MKSIDDARAKCLKDYMAATDRTMPLSSPQKITSFYAALYIELLHLSPENVTYSPCKKQRFFYIIDAIVRTRQEKE
ncbi:MAG: hypothetical protein HFG54_12175 [Lachnospiraceae bacterium]|nr:hypothetical protein [Lachnospiraceae bacterium]